MYKEKIEGEDKNRYEIFLVVRAIVEASESLLDDEVLDKLEAEAKQHLELDSMHASKEGLMTIKAKFHEFK